MIPTILAQAAEGDRRKGRQLGRKEMRLLAAFRDPESFQRRRRLLRAERVEDTLLELRRLAAAEDLDAEEEGPATAALRYLEKRWDMLFYPQPDEADLPIGCGLIESGHRHVLQSRLKLPGAWWLPKNADRMAKLRACKANGQWDELWQSAAA